MSEQPGFDLQKAHQYFAKHLNGEVWALLEKPDRTLLEGERMVHAAHASAYHWLEVGTLVHQQRAEWLLAHVYTVLKEGESALLHANRCLALTEEHAEEMADFDKAYAYEGMARACALCQNEEDAIWYYQLAKQAGRLIKDPEDRKIFEGDFGSGDWWGVEKS